MGKKNKPTKKAQKRAQVLMFTGSPPPGFIPVIGIVFNDGDVAIPDNIQQIASATYSLGSPVVPGVQRIAALSYSLGSPGIPTGLKRIAILPDTGA